MICLKSQISSSHLYLLLSEREGAKKSLFATRVVNLCSGKPDLPVKMFLPLILVKKVVQKVLICINFCPILAEIDGFNIWILELKAIILINSL